MIIMMCLQALIQQLIINHYHYKMQNQKIVRAALHAGTWYTQNKAKLDEELKFNLAKAEVQPKFADKKIKAIIGPHAGLKYSGPVAAWSYKYLEKQNKQKLRVFLFGPSHYKYLEGISFSKCTELQTPIGNIQVDVTTLNEIRQQVKHVTFTKKDQEKQHSLQMHMPYLRKMLGENIKIVPIIVGSIDAKTALSLGKTFAGYFDDQNTVFVISSDFCHWGDHFDYQPTNNGSKAIWQVIKQLDNQGMKLIEDHNLEGFSNYINKTGNTICGQNPIKLFLGTVLSSKNKHTTAFVNYDQSQKVITMDQSSVSYATSITVIS